MAKTIHSSVWAVAGALFLPVAPLFADLLPQPIDGKLTIDVPSGSVTYTDALPAGVTVEKTGGGEAVLTGACEGIPGDITISGGCLTVTTKHALGVVGANYQSSARNRITVAADATLKVNTPYPAEALTGVLRNHPLTIAGSGHDGNGCLQWAPTKPGEGSNTSMADALFGGEVTLSGDALVKVSTTYGRWGFYGVGQTQMFDLNGHKFTVEFDGNVSLMMGVMTLKNSGEKENGQIVIKRAAGAATGVPNARIVAYSSLTTDPDHPGVICLQGGGFQANGKNSTWTDFGSNWTMRAESNTTYERVYGNNGSYSDERGNIWYGKFESSKANTTYGLQSGYTGTFVFRGDIDVGIYNHSDSQVGAVYIEGPTFYANAVRTYAGPTYFSSPVMEIGYMVNENATNVFSNARIAGRGSSTDNSIYWDMDTPNKPNGTPMTVFENCFVTNSPNAGKETQIRTAVSQDQDACGILVVSNSTMFASISTVASRGRGTCVIDGCDTRIHNGQLLSLGFRETCGDSVGHARGYLEMNDGVLEVEKGAPGGIYIGQYGGQGFLRQNGGRIGLHAGGGTDLRAFGGYAAEYFAGGTVEITDKDAEWQFAGSTDPKYIPAGTEPTTEITIANDAVVHTLSRGVDTYRTNFPSTVSMTLRDGGTLWAAYFDIRLGAAFLTPDPSYKTYVNFDGGVIKPSVDTDGFNRFFYRRNKLGRATQVTVYDGGVTYDLSCITNADGSAATWRLGEPLKKATGKGLATITLPTSAAFLAEKYLGPARIHITSSTGFGATALLDIDGRTSVKKGVIVTCSGCDYTEDGTTVEIESATNATLRYACAYTLKDNAGTGGITKRGKGTLVLESDGDITGPLTVEGGSVDASDLAVLSRTIRMTCAAAFDPESGIFSSKDLDISSATIEITDPENLANYEGQTATLIRSSGKLIGLPSCEIEGWKLRNKGNALTLRKPTGLLLIFK